MRLLQKIISTINKEGHENYSEFCRRWEKNRELLNDSENSAALINNLSAILKEGETAKIEQRQYLTVTGDGFKYTARITWPEVK